MRNFTYVALLIGGLLLAASPAGAQTPPPGTVFRDCADACPEMVAIPPGAFTMGSPESEERWWEKDEGPQHSVTIGYSFAVGKFDVTRAEYAVFVASTGYKAEDGCTVYDGESFNKSSSANWQSPGFDQTNSDPVVCVSWDDAKAYAAWLSQKAGHVYRLLSESEWEYTARAGTTTAYWWGDAAGTNMTNCNGCGSKWDNKQPSPSGTFRPNPFALYDMNGNVEQWTVDCYNDSYNGAPNDGSAWGVGDCGTRVTRGGSWRLDAEVGRAGHRGGLYTYLRDTNVGFRVARTY